MKARASGQRNADGSSVRKGGLSLLARIGRHEPSPRENPRLRWSKRHFAQLPAYGDPTAIESATPTGGFIVSVVVRIRPSNMTRQQYDTVRNALTEAGDWPADGCQLHVLFGDENDMRVSEVWESREKLDAFGDKLRPRIQAA